MGYEVEYFDEDHDPTEEPVRCDCCGKPVGPQYFKVSYGGDYIIYRQSCFEKKLNKCVEAGLLEIEDMEIILSDFYDAWLERD